jgi:hypothetical protein
MKVWLVVCFDTLESEEDVQSIWSSEALAEAEASRLRSKPHAPETSIHVQEWDVDRA